MEITKTYPLADFEPWSGAVATWDILMFHDKIDTLEAVLSDIKETMTETELNDLLWFDNELVYSWVGLDKDGDFDRLETDDDVSNYVIIYADVENVGRVYLKSYYLEHMPTGSSCKYMLHYSTTKNKDSAIKYYAEDRDIDVFEKFAEQLTMYSRNGETFNVELINQPDTNEDTTS